MQPEKALLLWAHALQDLIEACGMEWAEAELAEALLCLRLDLQAEITGQDTDDLKPGMGETVH